ncbi:MAG: hypothetical protein PHN75_12835 [Syntrophales bacterium]|nr:hypothetical protein [Syntrophales bacterium]
MIEVINPGFYTIVVDGGRTGYGDMGIPASSALDLYAYRALQYLTASRDSPVLEVIGQKLTLKFNKDISCAITGAAVKADIDGDPVEGWVTFTVKKGSFLRIRNVMEGFRYYIGFSGLMDAEKAIDSYSTNVECRFGGFQGRLLRAGDRINFLKTWHVPRKRFPKAAIPSMAAPHEVRVLEGPEVESFSTSSTDKFWGKKDRFQYTVSAESNRAGIRLGGEPLAFKPDAETSIISEGILPGTIQIPGDGLPLIVLYERTIGGYARMGIVIRADRDRLAHLGPGDMVTFRRISMKQAGALWNEKYGMMQRFFS